MSLPPEAAPSPRKDARGAVFSGNRVVFALLLAAVAAAAGLSFLTVAPNRLVSGMGVRLSELLSGGRILVLCPAAVLAAAAFVRPTRLTCGVAAAAASLALAGVVWLAGDGAVQRSAVLSGNARVSLGGGFWVLAALAWLAGADAVQRLGLGLVWRVAAHAAVLMPALVLLSLGELDHLGLLKEYANRHDVFQAAWRRHLEIVLTTLVPSLGIGVPLGVAAARNERLASSVFAVLNVIQTVPSIALFGLLIAPLAWLANALPTLGIGAVGLLPAVIALTLYALLPIVHGTVSGLRQVPPGVVEAALGMGLTKRQLFWKVEATLALPVLLSGLRVTAVQVVGLAVVAALIGAGGFGALVFQGLESSALDLVMLGVVPVVALSLLIDGGFRILAAAFEGHGA
ncbi:MAG TPA: ABC transporter permease [Burkholderiaceae bacterium]